MKMLLSLMKATVLQKIYSCTHVIEKKQMFQRLYIGVTLFLLLTAASDQKINLASKLVYLFLSLASLLIFCLLQIGFSYKPERCTFLQPNLKSCAEKISLKAHCGSVCWCVSCRLGFLLQCAFDAFQPLWPLTARANSLGLLSPFFQITLLIGSFSFAK